MFPSFTAVKKWVIPICLYLGLVTAIFFLNNNLCAEPVPYLGWFHWRGPQQNGSSIEMGLPDRIALKNGNLLWTADFPGQSSAVIRDEKLYIMGYQGEGADLQEGVACFDAETGKRLWSHLFNDFLSDTIYLRYATSSPTIDFKTGNVYIQGTQGILACFTSEGKLLWQHSLMETYGRLTFPNSRTASPSIDGDLVITRGITSNWGVQGPAADRFYAFDKITGEAVWTSSPGDRPKDNSFSSPVFSWLNGKRVFYTGVGDGSVACINARTGDSLWRIPISKLGINASVLLYEGSGHEKDKLISIHGGENLDTAEVGRMAAFEISSVNSTNRFTAPVVLETKNVEIWRNDLSAFTSSPTLAGNRIYQVTDTGDLASIDVQSGKILWKQKLGIEQRNASVVYADDKLYIAILNDPDEKEIGGSETGSKGGFYIIKPGENGCEILSHIALEGRCFGTPTVFHGKVYVQTEKKLYCFGNKEKSDRISSYSVEPNWPSVGLKSQLQIIPSEVLLQPGEKKSFRIQVLDVNGFVVEEVKNPKLVKWSSYIPSTAKVKATMKAEFNNQGELVASAESVPSAGAFEATMGDLKGYIRGRILPNLPIQEDFESFAISEKHETEKGMMFAYPPLPWIGARFKFEVREREGNRVLAKTIDNKLFQRAFVFIGHPDMKNYTVEVDVLSDGNKRKMSEVGVINQRYCIVLKGNAQELEVNSNLERLRVSVPFKWLPNQWYHLKTRVDLSSDENGIVRARVWKKGEEEPKMWTIEVPHPHAHQNGSPGLFGFSPQEMRVYMDNIRVTKNE